MKKIIAFTAAVLFPLMAHAVPYNAAQDLAPVPKRGFTAERAGAHNPAPRAQKRAIAPKFSPLPVGGDNCRMVVEVVKIQEPTISFNVTPYFQTPNMGGLQQGGTYNLPEAAVNNFAIHASNRLCYIANDAARLGGPNGEGNCPETDLQIKGDLTGFGNFACPTFPGNL